MQNSLFFNSNETNYFDKLVVDVAALYKNHPIEQMRNTPSRRRLPDFANSRWHQIYRNRLLPLKLRQKLWQFNRQTHADISWFQAFSGYWSTVLGGRPLFSVHDLIFLKNLYRIRFQANEVPDTEDEAIHLMAWQQPEILYQLLHYVVKGGLQNQLHSVAQLRHLKRKPARIVEYGCSLAPIVSTMLEFYPLDNDLEIIICDIETVTFHYGAWRLRHCSNVRPIALKVEDGFQLQLNEPVDVIFCMTVFEHMNKPMETIQRFYDLLTPGGLLVFDYIKSDGHGLDTVQAVRERESVLRFIQESFELVQGTIDPNLSVSQTVVRKR
jgi:SAM-dependent methyltransferase